MKINSAKRFACAHSHCRSLSEARTKAGFSHTIFKAYDIRGIYPSEINEDIAYLIGRAFVQFLAKGKLNIVVGRDNRPSSQSLFENLVRGILDQGANVIDLGISTSPMLDFGVANFNFDGGIEITASHNPPEYNGFKLLREKAISIGQGTGLGKIKKLVIKGKFLKKKKGKIFKKVVLTDYLNFNFNLFEISKFKPLRIVIDTSNATAGILIPYLRKKIPGKIFPLFENLDGDFPNHLPDPSKIENCKILQEEIIRKKADLGVAFDGDGDRIVFVDEKGEIIPGDFITALIAAFLLKEKPGEKILYDIRSSKIVEEVIKKNGGIPVMSRVGHSFIKERMRKENILFGGEYSGHYYLRDQYFFEAPIAVFLKVLEIISKTGKKTSQLVKSFQKYFHSGEINFKLRGKKKILEKLEKRYKKGKISKIDGLRVDFQNWWFLVRPSQTEPILRLSIEAKRKKLMTEKKKELSSLILNFK